MNPPPPLPRPSRTVQGKTIESLMNPRRRGVAPYRVVLGHVRQKLQNTRRRLEELMNARGARRATYNSPSMR